MARFAPLKRAPAYVELAEAIIAEILEGKIKPGENLPIEKDLSEQFMVNRSTLREGLRVLEEAGLVIRQGKKLTVQKPSEESLGLAIGRALVLHDVTFDDIYILTSVLFPAAARLAATKATDIQLEALTKNTEQTKHVLGDPERLAHSDVEFLKLLAAASGNKALIISLEPLTLVLYAGFLTILKNIEVASERLFASHCNILDAIKSHDEEKSEYWTRKHAEDFKRAFGEAGIPIDTKISEVKHVIDALRP